MSKASTKMAEGVETLNWMRTTTVRITALAKNAHYHSYGNRPPFRTDENAVCP
jgi:hypothetical protein